MKELPQQVSESVRRRNPQLYGMTTGVAPTGETVSIITKPPKRIRQSTKPLMNKLEGEFLAWLKAFYPSEKFYPQAIRFRLANGVTYSPDIVSFTWSDQTTVWEVKGQMAWDDAIVKLKVFAAQYPEIDVRLAWKQNERWEQQRVLA